MTTVYRLIGSLALLLLLAFAAVNASPFQLRKSPKEKGAGVFVELKKYSENLYGPLPYGLLEKYSECHQWLEPQKYQGLQEQFKRSGLKYVSLDDVTTAARRQRIYEFKSELNNFMASQLLNGFNLAEMDYETFWLIPVVYFRKISHEQVQQLNFEFVEKVYENNLVAKIYDPIELMNDGEPDDYFLKKINVERVWESGNTGSGVKVGLIDTGARWTHDLLKKNYAGLKSGLSAAEVEHDYAWFDPHEFRDDEFWCLEGLCAPAECCLEEPFDIISHGSHVLGLILQIAPSVEWVAAKGCRDGNCLRYGLLKSAEFMACPSDRNGTNPDCSLAPDLINNSWGNHGDIRESFFEDIVKAWREMNIVPLFANGNSGPSCGTANSPGNFANVLGVGATDRNDRLTEFSSRGPGADTNETTIGKLAFQQQNQDEGFLNGESKTSLFGWMKPDLCAPGSKLYSAGGRSDDHYLTMSGTSMATPVVSGVVALMIAELKKHNKNVDYFDAVYNSLTQTAYRDLPEPAGKGGKIFPPFPWRRDVCGFTNYTTYPNHFYGHGRVDAFKAIQLLRN